MFEFRMAEHLHKPGQKIIEVWKDGERMAAVYPTKKGIKVVSKCFPFLPNKLQQVSREVVEIDCSVFPTSVLINII